jgi:hypothetical protein
VQRRCPIDFVAVVHRQGALEFVASDVDNAGFTLEGHESMEELDEWRVVFCQTSYGSWAPALKLEQQECAYIGCTTFLLYMACGFSNAS